MPVIVSPSPTTKTSPTLPLPMTVGPDGDISQLVMVLDALLHGGPKSATTATPPAGPSQGDLYIVPASPTGAWAGQAGNLAICNPQKVKDGRPNPYTFEWDFLGPKAGMSMYVQDTGMTYTYTGTAWIPAPLPMVASAPANSSAAGVKGQFFADATGTYFCTAASTWRKVATTTF